MDFIIENAIFNDKSTNLLIQNGKIQKISPDLIEGNVKRIDAHHKTIIPSLIDMQVHFREPGFEYKEDLQTGSKSAAAGGFTQVAIMPNTSPCLDSVEMIEDVQKRIKESSLVDVHIIPAMTKDLKGVDICDYEAFKNSGIVAITDDGKGVQDDQVMEEIFKRASKHELSILQHCEVDAISDGGAIHKGSYSQENNIRGIPSESEWKMIERDLSFLEQYGGHYHVLHVSSKKSVQLIKQAKSKGLNVTCEVTPHHLFLCDEDIQNTNFKMNPPLRSKEDMMALRESFLDGTIDIISTDHAPHSKEDKHKDIHEAAFGVIGLETSFPLLYSYFKEVGLCSLQDLVKAMSTRPAEIFNLKAPKVEEGEDANFVLIDTQSIEEVCENHIYSKSHNTPFFGHKLKGWPSMTVKNGEIIYER